MKYDCYQWNNSKFCLEVLFDALWRAVMDNALLEFKHVIDEEIKAYEDLGELYTVKQSVLINGKSDALWDIDAQILLKTDDIKLLNVKRKEAAKYLGDENLTMSEIIEKAKQANDSIAPKLEAQQGKLKILAKSLRLQEETHLTLIKHGLVMVNKTIDIIVGTVFPQTKQYNKMGKNIETDKSLISSVSEEV